MSEIDDARARLGFTTKPPGTPNTWRFVSVNGGAVTLALPPGAAAALEACASAGITPHEALLGAAEKLGGAS